MFSPFPPTSPEFPSPPPFLRSANSTKQENLLPYPSMGIYKCLLASVDRSEAVPQYKEASTQDFELLLLVHTCAV
jgi:hypothetical protein